MKILNKISPPESIDSAIMSPDGKFIATSNSLLGDVWIMDLQGNLVSTLTTEKSGSSKANMIVWEDDYIITLSDAQTAIYIWNSKDFSLIEKYTAPLKSYFESFFYKNNKLYLFVEVPFLEKSECEKGNLIGIPNLWVINLTTKDINKQIIQREVLLSGFTTSNNELILFSNQLLETKPPKWNSITNKLGGDRTEISNHTFSGVISCINDKTNDWAIIGKAKEYQLIYFNHETNQILNKTKEKIRNIALCPYKNTILCLFFDEHKYTYHLMDIKNNKVITLDNKPNEALSSFQDKVLIGLENDIYILELE